MFCHEGSPEPEPCWHSRCRQSDASAPSNCLVLPVNALRGILRTMFRQLRAPTRAEWIVVVITGIAVAALLIPPVQNVADGHFRLTVEINKNPHIDDDSILFATYWLAHGAERSLRSPGVYGHDFFRPTISDTGHAEFDVPWSGRSGRWRGLASYNHPQYLVVEHKNAGPSGKQELIRKLFSIPSGRGPRTMTIELQ